jgi:hypothetical protein
MRQVIIIIISSNIRFWKVDFIAMAMEQNSNKNGYSSDFIIRVKRNQHLPLKGTIKNIHIGQVWNFNDFLEMILLMQQAMNEQNQIFPEIVLRTFSNKNSMANGVGNDKQFQDKEFGAGELVFYVRVKFRRNSSMQGKVNWLNEKESKYFRSVLELGNLLYDAYKVSSDQIKQ